MGSYQNFFVFNPILMKLGEVVVPMDTTTSPSFIKIGLKTKKFSHEPISGTFECGVNNHTVEVHCHRLGSDLLLFCYLLEKNALSEIPIRQGLH